MTENSLKAVCENYELKLIEQYMFNARQNLIDYYETKIKPITNDTTKILAQLDDIKSATSSFSQIYFSIDADTLTLSKISTTNVGVRFSAEVK